MSAPLTAVLEALGSGASSRLAVTAATGLSPDVVDAAVEHLERLGRLEVRALTADCSSASCAGCAFARGCRAPATRRRTAPVRVS
jgi:hypothetical protein